MFIQMLETTDAGPKILFVVSLIKGKLKVTSGDKEAGEEFITSPLNLVRTGEVIDPVKRPKLFLQRAHEQSGTYFNVTKPMEVVSKV